MQTLLKVLIGPAIMAAIALLLGVVTAEADPPRRPAPVATLRDGGTPRDLAQPARVTRAFSDAWNLNLLRRQLLEAELARHVVEQHRLEAQGKAEFGVDLAGGDTFDEKTLEIHRR